MNVPSREEVKALREKYPPGTRIELIYMNDPYRPDMKPGTRGTVTQVDDMGTIFARWDCHCSLGVVYGIDRCRKIEEDASHDKLD